MEPARELLNAWYGTNSRAAIYRNPLNRFSLRLTQVGFTWCVKHAKLPSYKIQLANPITNKQMLQLENLFSAPYYIQNTGNVICVFSDTDAVMLQLHSGNLKQYLDNLESNIG